MEGTTNIGSKWKKLKRRRNNLLLRSETVDIYARLREIQRVFSPQMTDFSIQLLIFLQNYVKHSEGSSIFFLFFL